MDERLRPSVTNISCMILFEAVDGPIVKVHGRASTGSNNVIVLYMIYYMSRSLNVLS